MKFDSSVLKKLKVDRIHFHRANSLSHNLFKSRQKFTRPFDLLHLTSFGVDIKHTSMVSNAEGNFMFSRALYYLVEQV
jgi:hypothetical protein